MRRRDLLACSSLAAAAAFGKSPKSGNALDAAITACDTQIPGLMAEAKVPGVSVALITGGKLQWRKGFGVADAATGRRVDNDTIFQAASMSKPVFAYLVMKLAEKGVLDLDTPLTRYTPKRFLDGDPRLDLITARRVLSHTTGFPNWRSATDPLRINFTPGEKWSYSGEGYYYLQSVVTRLTGHEDPNVCRGGYEADFALCATDIASYMKANILEPLGMRSSSYFPNAKTAKKLARAHDKQGAPMERGKPNPVDPARYAAAGALLTTPADYAKFLAAVINPGPSDTHRLTPKTLEEMLRPQIDVTATPEYRISWALGWRVASARDAVFISHGGDNPGFHCLAEACVARKTGFVIMTNGEGGVELLRKFAPGLSRVIHAAGASVSDSVPDRKHRAASG